MEKILTLFKEYIDNLYYHKYSLGNRESVIRKSFPWITQVWEYRRLNEYLISMDRSTISKVNEALMSFYWWEAASLQQAGKCAEISNLRGIVDFVNSVDAYLQEASLLNKN